MTGFVVQGHDFGLHEWYGLFEICIKLVSEP